MPFWAHVSLSIMLTAMNRALIGWYGCSPALRSLVGPASGYGSLSPQNSESERGEEPPVCAPQILSIL